MSATLHTDLVERALLASPSAKELLARLDGATCQDVAEGFDRQEHVEQIALTVMRARGEA